MLFTAVIVETISAAPKRSSKYGHQASNPICFFVGLVEFHGEEFMGEPDGRVEELIDSMSAAFYSLAATGTVRVGRLCKGPQLLACFALELLEGQACHVSCSHHLIS